jgi:hypothetical protein
VAKQKQHTLSTFDGKLLDGLTFCRKVYELFDQIHASPNGTSKIRMRLTITEKRLIEELIPIACYVQARYRGGRRIKLRWHAGSQPFDAVLSSYGVLVEQGMFPKQLLVEVTASVHPNDHLVRQLIDQHGPAFGPKGTERDKKTGRIVSKLHVYQNDERVTDLTGQILQSLRKKSAKNYPPETVLIVDCVAGLLDQAEWEEAIQEVRKAKLHRAFREVFLCELVLFRSVTL